MKDNLRIRFAGEIDTPLILQMIVELAEYEKLAGEVTADMETLRVSLFEKKGAEVLICEHHGKPVAFALFFSNFSTFLGKPGIYIEDLYVRPEARGSGIGKELLSFISEIALQRGCGRVEWWCLDWNTEAIDFYKKCRATPMEEWTVYRLAGEALDNMAKDRLKN